MQRSPAQRGVELYYDALAASSDREEFLLLTKALQLHPDNAAVRFSLLRHRSMSPLEELAELRAILALEERHLGANVFTECKGHFWGVSETRPYMRIREHLAATLRSLGQSEEAVAEWEAMLDLNPNDNQGIRYLLLPEYLALGQVR